MEVDPRWSRFNTQVYHAMVKPCPHQAALVTAVAGHSHILTSISYITSVTETLFFFVVSLCLPMGDF